MKKRYNIDFQLSPEEYQLKLIEGQVRKTVELKDDMITSLKLQLVELKEKFI